MLAEVPLGVLPIVNAITWHSLWLAGGIPQGSIFSPTRGTRSEHLSQSHNGHSLQILTTTSSRDSTLNKTMEHKLLVG